MSWEREIEALEVEQWSGRRNPKEEEEGVFIPPSPELAVGAPCGLAGSPGTGDWVTRLLTEPTRVARPLVPVDPVGLEGEGEVSLRFYCGVRTFMFP
jgi:hypothetical protein